MPNLLGGGAERVLLTLIRHMGIDFQPRLLLLRNEVAYPDEIPDNAHLISISQKGERIRNNLPKLYQILKLINSQCDIIIGGLELDATYYAYVIGQLTRKPVIGWVHTPMPIYLQGYNVRHKLLTRWIYPRMKHIVFSSEYIQTTMDLVLGAKPIHGSVIDNPLDLEWIVKKSSEPLPTWSESILQKPYLIALGRLISEKGFISLLDGFSKAIARGLDYHLLILGEGSQRHAIEEVARSLGLFDRLFLPGFVPNPYPLILRAAMLASPSWFEGVGMTLLEAMALRVPVVANISAGGPAMILENGKFGYVVETNDPELWAAAIIRASQRDNSVIEDGFQKALSYTPSKAVDLWRDVINKCSQ
jgi:glycosyltransferase involved in cell wall biosynthesis